MYLYENETFLMHAVNVIKNFFKSPILWTKYFLYGLTNLLITEIIE